MEWKKSVVSEPMKGGWLSIAQYECPDCGFICNIEVVKSPQRLGMKVKQN